MNSKKVSFTAPVDKSKCCLKINNQQSSTIHGSLFASKESFHSPWPLIEVDHLAYIITQMETKVKKTTSISPEIPYTSSSSSTSSLELTTSDNEHSVINVNNISELHSKNAEYKPKLISRCKAISPNLLKTINKRVVIVDCRYPYEYNAGHIRGAINLADWPSLCQYFFGAKQIDESSVTDMHSLSLSLPKYLLVQSHLALYLYYIVNFLQNVHQNYFSFYAIMIEHSTSLHILL
ncbi:unnamed protein product [Heterobilharzia americana]|nr:unnamed protein product [Heterobilharzia americana]